jgi:hypothetical protein
MRAICVMFLLGLAHCLYSQDSVVDVKQLQTPNSPGFQILDISPSSIGRPTSPKQFALNIFNASNSGSSIPKNYAIEIAPYWFFRPTGERPKFYLNADHAISFKGILRKLSISTASAFNDSTSGSLLKNTNYLSIGLRTNVLTIRSKSLNKVINTALINMARRIRDVAPRTADHRLNVSDPDKIESAMAADAEYQSNLKNALLPPVFELDVAGAYSGAFPNNDFSNSRFDREGFWLTGDFTPTILKQKFGNLSLLGVFRLMNVNALMDTADNIFKTTNSADLGVSISYTFNQLSISGEYVNRSYSNNSTLDSYRKVLLIQYRVNKSLYVTGTYGKNFGDSKNLFALLGLNWGFSSSSIISNSE